MSPPRSSDPRLDGAAMRMVRLIWSPRSLPHAALNLTALSAVKGGFVGWFIFCGLLAGAMFGTVNEPFGSMGECVRSVAVAALIGGVGGALVVMILILLIAPIGEDETSIIGRAHLNVWLLLPWCLIAPLAVWALFATFSDPAMDIYGGKPAWLQWRAAQMLGLPQWLALLMVAMMLWPQVAALRVRRWLEGGRCTGCGYSLTGLIEPRCPECGRDILPGQRIDPPVRGQTL